MLECLGRRSRVRSLDRLRLTALKRCPRGGAGPSFANVEQTEDMWRDQGTDRGAVSHALLVPEGDTREQTPAALLPSSQCQATLMGLAVGDLGLT